MFNDLCDIVERVELLCCNWMETLITAAAIVGKLLMSEAAKAVLAWVNNQLQPDKMAQVLKDAIESAQATQPEKGGLFFRCQPKAAKDLSVAIS